MIGTWPGIQWSGTGPVLRIWMLWMCVTGLCVAGVSEMASAQVPLFKGKGPPPLQCPMRLQHKPTTLRLCTTIQQG